MTTALKHGNGNILLSHIDHSRLTEVIEVRPFTAALYATGLRGHHLTLSDLAGFAYSCILTFSVVLYEELYYYDLMLPYLLRGFA